MRSRLLSNHVSQFPAWEQLTQALDTVWDQLGIDEAIHQVKWLRSPINTQDVVINNGDQLVTLQAVPQQDRTSLVLTADMLGFRFYETNLLTTGDYLKLCRHLAEYYANDKGTPTWANFLGWCLNANFTVYNTWTENYVDFFVEGDTAIGDSIVDGGTWYPTTHVILEYDQNRFSGVEPAQIIEFFNYFANINLVLWMTQISGKELVPLEVAVTGSLRCIYPGSFQ
jgi:hypothetical protein